MFVIEFLYYIYTGKKYDVNYSMPVINRKGIREKKVKYKSDKKAKSEDFYNSIAWKRLQNTYISLHPLCECCMEHGRVVPAAAVHHKHPFLRGETEEEQWQLFLDQKNLMSVCNKCHIALHNKDREYHLGCLDSLSDLEYRYTHGLNY
jgi:5-methylcytosine-specific restriction protein A